MVDDVNTGLLLPWHAAKKGEQHPGFHGGPRPQAYLGIQPHKKGQKEQHPGFQRGPPP